MIRQSVFSDQSKYNGLNIKKEKERYRDRDGATEITGGRETEAETEKGREVEREEQWR